MNSIYEKVNSILSLIIHSRTSSQQLLIHGMDDVRPSPTLPLPGYNGYINNNTLFRIYPNPVKDELTIEIPALYEGNVQIEIIDVSGRRAGYYSNTLQLSLSELKAGLYFIRISSNGVLVHTDKFTKL